MMFFKPMTQLHLDTKSLRYGTMFFTLWNDTAYATERQRLRNGTTTLTRPTDVSYAMERQCLRDGTNLLKWLSQRAPAVDLRYGTIGQTSACVLTRSIA